MSAVAVEGNRCSRGPSDPRALYRLFDSNGVLLYIGISFRPELRIYSHRTEKPWRAEIHTWTLEWHPTKAAALRAEQAAIEAEEPRYNEVHTSGWRERWLESCRRAAQARRDARDNAIREDPDPNHAAVGRRFAVSSTWVKRVRGVIGQTKESVT